MKYTNIISAVPEGEHFDASAVNEGVWLSVGHLDSIENLLSSHAEEVAALNSGIAQQETVVEGLNATINANNETITANATRITELEAEVARLKAAPAGSMSTTTKDEDKIGAQSVVGGDPVNAEAARLRAIKNRK